MPIEQSPTGSAFFGLLDVCLLLAEACVRRFQRHQVLIKLSYRSVDLTSVTYFMSHPRVRANRNLCVMREVRITFVQVHGIIWAHETCCATIRSQSCFNLTREAGVPCGLNYGANGRAFTDLKQP